MADVWPTVPALLHTQVIECGYADCWPDNCHPYIAILFGTNFLGMFLLLVSSCSYVSGKYPLTKCLASIIS